MDYKRSKGRRSAVSRVWGYCVLLSVPAIVFFVILLYRHPVSFGGALLLISCLLVYFLLISAALVEGVIRPLQTLSNVVSSLREGDYSFRARGARTADAFGELAREVNALADLLQKQRVRSLEATALLARILEAMHAPLFAFDRNDQLQLANHAGLKLLGLPHARCFGRTAHELGLGDLLAANDQTIHAIGSNQRPSAGPTRWLLRKAVFRQDGAPHTLLLLADVSLPLQEEEQMAWKRLIRVLGHELSNSLAPIKSIAGNLLSQMAAVQGEEVVVRDFRRGLEVIESRSDALHRFVQSYRQLAQLPQPRCRPVEIGALVERVAALEQRLAVELEAGARVVVQADPDQLEQMLINILANAVDASLANQAQAVRVSWHREASNLLILIEDSGLGIANTENLFVPFYTTKPTGSGVGLALAQQIARGHGGEIVLGNREDGSGARATIRLPLGQE